MSKVSLDHQNVLAAEAKTPSGVPVIMMNLVALNAEAEYEDSRENHVPAWKRIYSDMPRRSMK